MDRIESVNTDDFKFPVSVSLIDYEEPFHWQEDGLEIICVIKGTVEVKVNNKAFILCEDDILLIHGEDAHRVKKIDEDFILISFNFNINYFEKHFPNISRMLFYCNPDVNTIEKSLIIKRLRNKLAQILLEFKNKSENYEYRIISNATSILTILVNNFNSIGKSPENYRNIEQFERIWNVYEYLYNNYTKKISLSEVAQYAHVSEPYLSHSIKESLGMSFEEMLNYVRSESSIKLLLTSKKSLTQISYECGFSDPRYFNSFFSRFFKCNPAEYRANNKMDYNNLDTRNENDKIIYDELLVEKINLYILGEGIIQKKVLNDGVINLELNIEEESFLFNHYWQDHIAVGDAVNLLKTNYNDFLIEIQEEINFNYIKICNLFSLEFMQMKQKPIIIDWYSLFRIIDKIKELKSKPFIEMPIEKYSSKAYRDIFNNFIEKCIEKYGQEEIGQWKFSVVKDNDDDKLNMFMNRTKTKYNGLHFSFTDLCKDKTQHLLYDTAFMVPFFINNVLKANHNHDFPTMFNNIFDPFDNKIFTGGNGLITINGLKKPLYYAYYMLSMLGDRAIQSGDNYFITQKEEDIQILLYNGPKSSEENSIKEMEIDNLSRYTAFILEKDIDITIRISNLRNKEYLVRKYQFSRKSGSVFDQIINIEDIQFILEADKQYLNRISYPRMKLDFIKNCEYIDFKSILEPNSVELIILQKI